MHNSSAFNDVRVNPSEGPMSRQKSCALLSTKDGSRILILHVDVVGLLTCVVFLSVLVWRLLAKHAAYL